MGCLQSSKSIGRKFLRGDVGSAAVEFAMVSPIFIVLILATLQLGVVYFAKSYLETGAEQGARLVLTNNAVTTSNGVTSPMTQTQFQAAICAQFTVLINCANLVVQLEPLPNNTTSVSSMMPTYKSDGTLAAPTTFTTGSGGQNMLLIVEYPLPVIGGALGFNFSTLGNGSLLLVSTQIFRIES